MEDKSVLSRLIPVFILFTFGFLGYYLEQMWMVYTYMGFIWFAIVLVTSICMIGLYSIIKNDLESEFLNRVKKPLTIREIVLGLFSATLTTTLLVLMQANVTVAVYLIFVLMSWLIAYQIGDNDET